MSCMMYMIVVTYVIIYVSTSTNKFYSFVFRERADFGQLFLDKYDCSKLKGVKRQK